MSDSTWADELLREGESGLPADDFTWTTGDNYGLDGYQYDITYGEGVLDGASLPTVQGLSTLPEGLFAQERDVSNEATLAMTDDLTGLDLGMFVGDTGTFKTAAELTDLSWLADAEQDPDRLPHNPVDIKSELEDSWKVASLVPNQGILPRVPQTARVSPQETLAAVHKAARRSHYGHSLEDIRQELVATIGDTPFAKKALSRIQAEHGLVGNVYVRASVFPGLKNGRWVEQLKRSASSAKYIVTDDSLVAAKVGKQMVADVPWQEAFAHYQPRLYAAGYGMPKTGSLSDRLRLAFLTTPMVQAPEPGYRPRAHVEERPVAKAAAVVPVADLVQSQKRAKALEQVGRLVKAGQLTTAEALQLQASSGSPLSIVAAAEALVVAKELRKGQYTGVGEGTNRPQVQHTVSSVAEQQAAVRASARLSMQRWLRKAVKVKALLPHEAAKLGALDKSPAEILRLASLVIRTAEERRPAPELQAARQYEGTVFNQQVAETTPASQVRTDERRNLLRWARQQLSEGLAGKEFDSLFQARWAEPVRKASQQELLALREEHEGLAGHLYVEAAAYASPSGTTGCDKGALKHRGNPLKLVMAMPRCATCTFARTLEDGRTVCSNYNKTLVNELPVADKRAYQQESLRLANGTDADRTVALFDPGEFNLQSSLDGEISLAGTSEADVLGEVLFGEGFVVP